MLKKTMQSVDSQTYTNYEYIVIDGNSTDGTLDFLKNYEGKLTKYVSESDQGIYDAMNKGVKMSSGDYVIFLNAGDLFADATTLEKIFKDKIYDSDVIYGDVIKNGKIKPAEKPHNAHKMYFCHQSCFTKLECLRQFPFDTKYKMSADFNFFKILTLNNKTFKQLNIPIAIFDTTGVSNTKRSKGLKENINVVNEHDNIINKVRLLPRLYFVYLYAKLRGK
jgi:glycosyltransferase involved in cell wall biosynthesis